MFAFYIIIKFNFIRNKNKTNPTRIVTMCMEQWSTGENVDNDKHRYRMVYTILLSILQVNTQVS